MGSRAAGSTTTRARSTSPTIPTWGGRRAMAARAWLVQSLPAPCARCTLPVLPSQHWVVGHIKSRASHPELTWEPSNWQVEHRGCSDRSAQSAVQEAAGRKALRSAGLDPDFFPSAASPTPPPRPVSLSPEPARPISAPPIPPRAPSDSTSGIEVPTRLTWGAQGDLRAVPWLAWLADVPEDAGVPLAMSPVHPDAVGSYGPEAVAWIERTQRITLRWWQRLAICRQLEHDHTGRLVWRVIVESASRRVGKSVRLRGVALWRLEHGAELFGEPQLVIHTGKDVAIVREIQQKAWRWAEDVQGWSVARANGKEAMETGGGDRWLARAMHSVYGYDVALGMVDEAWGVDPAAVDEGLEPATMERPSPQLHLTSTAHRKASSLMRRRLSDALTADDGETLLLLWAASAGSDPGSVDTWRAASPHWSEDRRRMLAARFEKAQAGEVDPEADDLDPMAGFLAQYLNQWTLKKTAQVAGEPIVSEGAWAGLEDPAGHGQPRAVAVEGWPGEGLSLVKAWATPRGVTLSAQDVPNVARAAELVRRSGSRTVLVGASLAHDPAWAGLRVTEKTSAARTAVSDLKGLLRDGAIQHDGGEHLSAQVLELRTSPGSDGLRLRSTGRSDAVKAAVWAAQAVRRKPVGRIRIVGPGD